MKQFEEEILNLIQDGGTSVNKALNIIYGHASYKAHFMRTLQRLGAQEAEVEDFFQDAILQTVVNIQAGRFRGNSQLSTYLVSIGKHLWLNKMKRNKLQHQYFESQENTELKDENPEQFMIYSERMESLHQKLSELGEVCQKLLSLWSLNYSMKEIAQKLGHASEGYSRKKKHHCMQTLIRIIKKDKSIINLLQP